MPEEKKKVKTPVDETVGQVLEKLEDADSILVTLSRDPSVDEMATALALTMALDGVGKHATAIYSGETPNVIKFLNPEKTFETNTNSLQDFIIALGKEKADHLRYKVEGDFVKVYITPYKTTISEKDLEFSRGDINVDMVICLNVTNQDDLDKALEEHGRILHDAALVNISNGAPGQTGGIEWNNDKASSVAEMAYMMLEKMGAKYSPDVATALLTGIIAATERFSNDKTTSETMAIGAKLMQNGADQQLIALNMKPKESQKEEPEKEEVAPDSIEADSEVPLSPEQELERMISGGNTGLTELNDTKKSSANNLITELSGIVQEKDKTGKEVVNMQNEQPTIEQEFASQIPEVGQVLSVSEETIPQIPMQSIPEVANTPITANTQMGYIPDGAKQALAGDVDMTNLQASVSTGVVPAANVYGTAQERTEYHDGTVDPLDNEERPKDYGAMMEEALAEATPSISLMPTQPAVQTIPQAVSQPIPQQTTQQVVQQIPQQPVVQAVPQPAVAAPVAEQSIDDMVNQMVSQAQANNTINLPPPPAPPIDIIPMPPSTTPSLPQVQVSTQLNPSMQAAVQSSAQPIIQPSTSSVAQANVQSVGQQTIQGSVPEPDPSAASGIPAVPTVASQSVEPVNPVVVQPVQNPASVQPVQDPGSFKIPGM